MSPSRFVFLYGLAALAAGSAFVVHLALRFQNVAMGYEVERTRAETLHVRSQINEVRLELAARRAPQVLERIGRDELGMVEPDRVPTLVAGGSVRPARLSGRPR